MRDISILNKTPGIRGLSNVRNIDFPAEEQQKLKQISGKGNATFFLPNHPEFFTDWMLDKYVLSKVAPTSASWATGDIVNGMGKVMQKFWLNNNLIAQIPGQSNFGKDYSVKSAQRGDGVLLHPEGQVSWYGNHIAPLFSGAAEMAIDAYNKGVANSQDFKSWLAPIVWKLRFNHDVRLNLLKECDYVERRLNIEWTTNDCPAQRVYQIYLQLAKREYYKSIGVADTFVDMHLMQLRDRIIGKSQSKLREVLTIEDQSQSLVLRQTSHWLRGNTHHKQYKIIKNIFKVYKRWLRLKDCSFKSVDISQEEIAEHLKRIRADFCGGSVRDRMNKYLPQAVGPRTVHIRTVEPLAIHKLITTNADIDPAGIMPQIRSAMQEKLDALNVELEQRFERIKMFNPFYFASTI